MRVEVSRGGKHRGRHGAVLMACIGLLLNDCVRAGFEPSTRDNDAQISLDGTPELQVDVSSTDVSSTDVSLTDGPFAFEGVLGSEQCTSGGLTTITAPTGFIAAIGQTLIVRVVLRASPDQAVSATDDQGNVYQVDLDVRHDSASSGTRTVILSSHLNGSVMAGDQIHVSHPDADANAVMIEALSGITDQARVAATNWAQGESRDPAVTLAAGEGGLAYGFISVSNDKPLTPPSGWTEIGLTHIACGGAPGNATALAAIRFGLPSEEVTLSSTFATSPNWVAGLIRYRAAL